MPQGIALPPESAVTVRQLLAFYLDAGVDCALAEASVNRLSDPDTAIPAREPAPSRPLAAAAPIPVTRSGAGRGDVALAPDAAIMMAREAARTAPSLAALRNLLENFEGCALKFTATRLVFADGNPQARIMFVGE